MYEAQLASDWTYILNDSGSSVVFCATQDIYDRVQKEVLPSTPSVKAALCLDAPEGAPHAFATAMSASDIDKDGKLVLPPTGDDLANLIYTSGTTGKPKGWSYITSLLSKINVPDFVYFYFIAWIHTLLGKELSSHTKTFQQILSQQVEA